MDKTIPQILQIEPIFGCNANCIMCAINVPTKREKGVMPMALFEKIVSDLSPYTDTIRQVDLFGLGEPLLDPDIFAKIRLLKQEGFTSVGISTNCDLLDEEKQQKLLDSGLDTLIVSIDSIQKDIHEQIRVNTDFDKVVANTRSIIEKRDAGDYKTKFLIRFIRQQLNQYEWDDFKAYWTPLLTHDAGDRVSVYDAHNWVGEVPEVGVTERTQEIDEQPCYQVFHRMFILRDGTMSMCSCDLHHPYTPIGNVTDAHCLDVFNNEKMQAIREAHNSGRKNTIDICRKCNMLYSRESRKVE